jgi:AraC-like DNA-binding protein
MSSFQSYAVDQSWSSTSLPKPAAIRQWQDWASESIARMEIDIPDHGSFSADQITIGLGPLALVTVRATEQHIRHPGDTRTGDPIFQLLYSRAKCFYTRVGAIDFCLRPGECVLLNNGEPYQMRTEGEHIATVLTMRQSWIERWLPEPWTAVAKPFGIETKWAAPLGRLITAIVDDVDAAALPRSIIAEQIGPLLALAAGYRPSGSGSHRARLRRRLLQLIEERAADPHLDVMAVASELGISKRYVHALLAEAGTTFRDSMNSIRLERARQCLADSRRTGHRISEIAWRCGFLDPDYFARIFRRKYGRAPSEWRKRILL